MPTLIIIEHDSERREYLLDDMELCCVNHDEDGWNGMSKIHDLLMKLSDREGWDVMYSEGEE